jgi:hypothetical protein
MSGRRITDQHVRRMMDERRIGELDQAKRPALKKR